MTPETFPALGLSPECEILLCSARPKADHHTLTRIRQLLETDLDWDFLTREAVRHRMVPMLYWLMNSNGIEPRSEEVMAQLLGHLERTARRNLFLSGELRRIVRTLERGGVPAIPFKGPVMAQSLYGNLALREHDDLDILVRSGDVLKAREALLQAGFRPELDIARTLEHAYFKDECEYGFVGREGSQRVRLEVHWAFARGYHSIGLDLDSMWGRSRWIPFGGVMVRTLAPEDMLLALCVHSGAKHLWERLAWVSDFAHLILVHTEMDWDLVLHQARDLGLERVLLVSLSLANALLGALLPSRVLERIRSDSTVTSLCSTVQGRLFDQSRPGLLGPRAHLLRLKLRERQRDRLRYCLGLMVAPDDADWVSTSTSKPFNSFDSFVRPLRRVVRFGGKALGRTCWPTGKE